MDSLELMRSGCWHNGFTNEIFEALIRAEELCFQYNSLSPRQRDSRHDIMRGLIGKIEEPFDIHSPFHCDFGTNITIGPNFVGNYNLTILDEAQVTIGSNVFIGPNVGIYTVIHALDHRQRNEGIMRSKPVTIGDNVWIGAGVTILPGVTIGERAVIGAGSVVTHDIPAGVLAFGNPCKVVRDITGSDTVSDIKE